MSEARRETPMIDFNTPATCVIGLALNVTIMLVGAQATELTLIKDGEARCTIVVPREDQRGPEHPRHETRPDKARRRFQPVPAQDVGRQLVQAGNTGPGPLGAAGRHRKGEMNRT